MPDEKDLQANKDQVSMILDQLRAQAGPRGATFAGRTLQPTDTPASIMGRMAGSVPGEEALTAPVPAIAAGTGFLKALQEVVKGLKGKFPSSILEDIIKREQKLGKPPNPRDVPPLTAGQQHELSKMSPTATEKAVGMSRRPPHAGPTSMSISDLLKIADPNVPIAKIRSQERAYLDNLKKQIQSQGLQNPVLVETRKGVPTRLLEGHHRIAALEELGSKDIPVRFKEK